MSMSINANQIYASIRDRGQTQADAWAGQARGFGASNKESAAKNSPTSTRALEYQQRTQQKKDN